MPSTFRCACESSSSSATSVRGVSGMDDRPDEGEDEWMVESEGRDDNVELSDRACRSTRFSGLGERVKAGKDEEAPSSPRPNPVLVPGPGGRL